MAKIVTYKVIHWSILSIIVFQVTAVSGQSPQISLPQRAEINRYDHHPKQTVARMLNDLSFYYVSRYGYDRFSEENSDLVLRYTPTDLTAYQYYANVYTAQALYVINACGSPPKERLPEYPQAYALFNRMLRAYEKVDSLGYEAMPAEIYQNWLKQLDKEKTLPENQPSPIIQFKK